MSYLSYCGLLCDDCPLYMATKNNDQQAKEKLAREYSTADTLFIAEDMTCEGCFWEKNDSSKMCGDCEIRRCAQGKTVENCGHCSAYPCEIVERRLPGETDCRKRLDSMAGR